MRTHTHLHEGPAPAPLSLPGHALDFDDLVLFVDVKHWFASVFVLPPQHHTVDLQYAQMLDIIVHEALVLEFDLAGTGIGRVIGRVWVGIRFRLSTTTFMSGSGLTISSASLRP